MKGKKTYFAGLNALRFIAAFLVIFNHIHQYKFWASQPNAWGHTLIDGLGHLPVSFFFVLSGFLITYLLLNELERTGLINIRFFYWKRIIRIWPLYLIVAAISLTIIPSLQSDIFPNLPLPTSAGTYLAIFSFTPNLLRISFPTLLGANQLWSVGVEEQFYLLWPVLILFFHRRMFEFLITLIIIKVITQTVFTLITIESDFILAVLKLYTLFPIEQLGIGGLGAWLWSRKMDKIFSWFANPISVLASIGIGYYFNHFIWSIGISGLIQGFIFMQIIILVITSTTISRAFEAKWLSYLGEISYGIYMWHTLIIFFAMKFLYMIEAPGHWSIFIIVPLLTLLIAHISYQLIELKLLLLRDLSLRKVKLPNRNHVQS
ncbi:MAG: acyltransferase [Cyclobacteriaceae bacterium]